MKYPFRSYTGIYAALWGERQCTCAYAVPTTKMRTKAGLSPNTAFTLGLLRKASKALGYPYEGAPQSRVQLWNIPVPTDIRGMAMLIVPPSGRRDLIGIINEFAQGSWAGTTVDWRGIPIDRSEVIGVFAAKDFEEIGENSSFRLPQPNNLCLIGLGDEASSLLVNIKIQGGITDARLMRSPNIRQFLMDLILRKSPETKRTSDVHPHQHSRERGVSAGYGK